ncbi:MAG: PTS sugar transporter subunit IIA [Rhodopirellula sp.]|nr:PTS sugar transporter subunit IIA [Rhodopirellula sp.]
MMNYLDVAMHAAGQEAMDAEEYCQTCGKHFCTVSLFEDGPEACPECGVLSRLLRVMGRGELPFLEADAVLPSLKATHKNDAIREIVESLANAGVLSETDTESITDTLLRREGLASTGIGEGVALPHTRHPAITREVGTIAWSTRGVDFQSVDGRTVHLIVLLLSPVNQHSDHVRALAKIAKYIRSRG